MSKKQELKTEKEKKMVKTMRMEKKEEPLRMKKTLKPLLRMKKTKTKLTRSLGEGIEEAASDIVKSNLEDNQEKGKNQSEAFYKQFPKFKKR